MKRYKPKKRRDRRTSLSPYARKRKAPYQYSSDYQAWRRAALAGRVRELAEVQQ